MSIDRDDPRLTQYALDEMDDSARAAFKRELEADPAAAAEVDAIRATAALVDAELQAETAPGLSHDQRTKVARAARGRRVPIVFLATAAAACLAIGVAVHFGTQDPVAMWDAQNAQRSQADRIETSRAVVVGALQEVEHLDFDGYAGEPPNTESYARIREQHFVRVGDQDVSTFSIDVDTASYANVRRFLNDGRMPPKDAVRVEEFLNYFRYDYEPPPDDGARPFRTHVEVAACPWNARHRLARIALKGKEMRPERRPEANFVFLVDVSGSMQSADKLPLLKDGLRLLVEHLDGRDRVALVVYAGNAGLVLPSTPCDHTAEVLGAIERIEAGGSTNGGAGIRLAYAVAKENFVRGGANRVVLCTDGDFNVGVSDTASLTRMVEAEAKSNVFLSILGFGTGNYKDDRMEELSNRGNGNYAYIDSRREARKVLLEELTSTLVTIAKDVKIQVFFNPQTVAGWRLIGYENRRLEKQDFNDDRKDAGEIGAGHAVTALYELVPAGTEMPGPRVDPNPFVEREDRPGPLAASGALFQLRLRYKLPEGDRSTLLEEFVHDRGGDFDASSADFRWAASVAAFGMLLRDSPFRGGMTWGGIAEIARGATGPDRWGYRVEFLELVEKATVLAPK